MRQHAAPSPLPQPPRPPFATAAVPVQAALLPPEDRRWGTPMTLALLAHLALAVALTYSINWQKTNPHTVAQVELWSAMPQQAAPKLVAQDPQADEPPPPPAPAPRARPAPPPPPPVRATDPEPTNKVDIALEEAKKRAEKERMARQEREQRELKERQERERQAKLEQDRRAKEKQELAEKQKAEKAEKDKAEKERLAKEKAAQDKERERQAKLDREKAQQDKQNKEREAAEAKERDAKRRAQVMAMAGASGGENATGTALRDSGPSASYGGKVVAAVRPNITFTDTVSGNPAAEVDVRLLPDGTIVSSRLVKSSGVAAWDQAVLKALEKTNRLPRDENGKVPTNMVITFKLRD